MRSTEEMQGDMATILRVIQAARRTDKPLKVPVLDALELLALTAVNVIARVEALDAAEARRNSAVVKAQYGE